MTTTIYVRLTDESQAEKFAKAIAPIVSKHGGGNVAFRNSENCKPAKGSLRQATATKKLKTLSRATVLGTTGDIVSP